MAASIFAAELLPALSSLGKEKASAVRKIGGGREAGGELEVDPEPTREATERERSLPRFIARWRVVRGFRPR